MLDTSADMLKKQQEIIFNKTLSERFLIGVDTIDFGRLIVESSIKQKNPHISPLDLKIEVLKRYYQNLYSKNEFKKVIESLENYLKLSESNC